MTGRLEILRYIARGEDAVEEDAAGQGDVAVAH
jgi:hypothetical protein